MVSSTSETLRISDRRGYEFSYWGFEYTEYTSHTCAGSKGKRIGSRMGIWQNGKTLTKLIKACKDECSKHLTCTGFAVEKSKRCYLRSGYLNMRGRSGNSCFEKFSYGNFPKGPQLAETQLVWWGLAALYSTKEEAKNKRCGWKKFAGDPLKRKNISECMKECNEDDTCLKFMRQGSRCVKYSGGKPVNLSRALNERRTSYCYELKEYL